MNLYKLSTKGLGEYFVIDESPNDAQEALTKLLNKAEYGFSFDRKVESITLMSSQVTEGFTGKPNFSEDDRLIIHSQNTLI